MQLPEGLHFSVEEGVATLRLDRADRLNSLTFEIYQALVDTFHALQGMDEVRAVIVTGTGKGFCSGGDVHDIIGKLISASPTEMTAFARMTGDVIRNMRRLRKPIVAAINGTAAGAGAVIALASDLRIAADNAKIAFLFTKVGLTGADMGAAYLLPRVIGLSRATELLMLGDSVLAEDAHRIGLFNQVVPPQALMERATQVARRLAEGPTFSLGMTKELLNNSMSMDLNTALDAEARAQTICMLADDFKEFHASFVEKRKPVFKGK
ncbi:MAG: enoyl-CoA hydratase family protein [Deltaproteobacteria bacterium]|nr:enoyl-CoA hydratase family protein [Deltaproteobacteria bacterium]